MFQLFWDLYQQRQIGQLQTDVRMETEEARRAGREAATREFVELSARLDKLVLVTHAMWSTLAEKAGVTDDDLIRRMTEIDAQDGTVDGRVTRQPVRCSCGAMVCHKFSRCLFCGKEYQAPGALGAL